MHLVRARGYAQEVFGVRARGNRAQFFGHKRSLAQGVLDARGFWGTRKRVRARGRKISGARGCAWMRHFGSPEAY